jgi:hypothetical protein
LNRCLHTHVHKMKQLKYSPMDEWLYNIQYVHTMKYSSTFERHEVLKRNEILTNRWPVTLKRNATLMVQHRWTLKTVGLREINQGERANSMWFHFPKVPRTAKVMEAESRTRVTRGWGWGKGEQGAWV